jgi:hypothetical protein
MLIETLIINVIYYLIINVKTDNQDENFNYLYYVGDLSFIPKHSLTPPP